MIISDECIRLVAEEDPATLAALDARGILPGPGESGEQFAERLKTLNHNVAEMDKALDEEGAVTMAGVRLKRDARIPAEHFDEAAAVTAPRYGIRVDWVPGFFVNPKFSWLFGGCAFYQYPDFLALFIIRRSFAKCRRWLIYRRDELLAHELCHVARMALDSQVFEEHFAYRISTSRFRRVIGPVVRRPAESFAVLACCFLLLGAQIVQVAWVPALRMFPFWFLLAALLAFLGARLRRERLTLNAAVESLNRVFPDHGEQAAFRLADAEIADIAESGDSAEEVEAKLPGDLRTRIMRERFSPSNSDSENR